MRLLGRKENRTTREEWWRREKNRNVRVGGERGEAMEEEEPVIYTWLFVP